MSFPLSLRKLLFLGQIANSLAWIFRPAFILPWPDFSVSCCLLPRAPNSSQTGFYTLSFSFCNPCLNVYCPSGPFCSRTIKAYGSFNFQREPFRAFYLATCYVIYCGLEQVYSSRLYLRIGFPLWLLGWWIICVKNCINCLGRPSQVCWIPHFSGMVTAVWTGRTGTLRCSLCVSLCCAPLHWAFCVPDTWERQALCACSVQQRTEQWTDRDGRRFEKRVRTFSVQLFLICDLDHSIPCLWHVQSSVPTSGSQACWGSETSPSRNADHDLLPVLRARYTLGWCPVEAFRLGKRSHNLWHFIITSALGHE